MGDQTFRKMVWKRKFLYLVCVGSVVACMIFINTNKDEPVSFGHSRLQASEYVIASTEGIESPSVQQSVSGGQNIKGRFHHSLLPTVRLSRTNLPTFNQSFSTKTETLMRHFSNSSSKASDMNRNFFINSSFINLEAGNQGKLSSSEIFYKAPNRTLLSLILGDKNDQARSINNHYNRVFQWDDRDPEGWRGLPFSKGEVAPKTDRIIFNRVGKCGSRSMIAMLRDLAQQNGFNLISSVVYNQTHVPKLREKHIVSILDQVQPPYLFQRHIHYVNFKRHMAQEVVYINIIREPIARMVSQYYFARYGDGILGKARAKWNRPLEEFNETIDECVKHEHRDCSGHRTFYIIPFFCGNSKRCVTPSKWALQRAMYNVQNNFLVVGILEEFDLTLRILETVLPTFFAGAMELYQTSANVAENITKTTTSFKIPPSKETIEILKERLKYEYKFYNFVKQRLYEQKARLGL